MLSMEESTGDSGTHTCSGGFRWLGEGCLAHQNDRAWNGSKGAVPCPPLAPLLAEGILLVRLNSLLGVERLDQTYTFTLTRQLSFFIEAK